MLTWDDFATASPELAAKGRQLFERADFGGALLATVRDDLAPRVHPISLAIVDGRLMAFLIVGSGKVADLEADGRYALHAYFNPAAPHEFQVRGHAREVTDPVARAAVAANWKFEADDGYRLFEFQIEHAIFGERADPHDWPPVHTSWKAHSG